MYSTVKSPTKNHCRIGKDKDYLRIQFSTEISKTFYGKRQKYHSLNREDTSENRQWAEGIAARINADINHPDVAKLFDPTLAKYLGIEVKVTSLFVNKNRPDALLKDVWNDLVEYKYKTGKIRQTTYQTRYKRTFANWLADYLELPVTEDLGERILIDLLGKGINKANLKKLIGALGEACDRAINKVVVNAMLN